MNLLALQRNFREFLLDGPTDLAAAMSEGARAGLPVYHNAYRAQLVSALRDSHERLWAWLGDEAFETACRHHIAAHPPKSWTLGDYGLGFDATLAALYPGDLEVAEIAALDWALRRAFDGPDAAPVDPGRLAQVDWESAVLHFVPTLAFVPVATNCGAIWNAIAANEVVPAAQMLPAAASIRIWRAGLEPRFRTIEETECRAMGLCLAGLAFSKVCDRLATEGGITDAVDVAGRLLASWLEDGLIFDVR